MWIVDFHRKPSGHFLLDVTQTQELVFFDWMPSAYTYIVLVHRDGKVDITAVISVYQH